jgi:uncharacterized protein YndB with AHSA1/START domain
MSDPLYSVERAYPVAIDALWNAWVDADALEQWYSPTALQVLPGSVVSDAREGGWWTVGVDVKEFGFVAYFYGTYSEVVPHSRLVHSLYYTQDAAEFASRDLTLAHHVIHVDFEERGDTAWVRFTQFGEMPAEEAAGAKEGMESYFDNLERFLTRT